MSQFTPAVDAALAAPVATIFGALQIELPDYTLRLLSGPAALKGAPWSSFVGRDPTFGIWAAVADIRDGGGDEAPRISITLFPASDAAAATLAAPNMQGSKVSIWLGVVNPLTGEPIPDPALIFLGSLDVPRLVSGTGSRQLEYEVASVFEWMFDEEEGRRLADTFHQSIWPGELGFAFVTGVVDQVYWGRQAPVTNLSSMPPSLAAIFR